MNDSDNKACNEAQYSEGSGVTQDGPRIIQGPSWEKSHEPHIPDLRDPTEDLKANVLAMIMKDMKRGVKGILEFAKKIPGFVDLHNEDQAALLHGKICQGFSLLSSDYFLSPEAYYNLHSRKYRGYLIFR